jgi:O-acetyl-ADP-ribose deacetylase (regulator of RNase III)
VEKITIRIVGRKLKKIEFHGPADITEETTDAIVNAANTHLIGGGGVDGAIHDAGGPAILQQCRDFVASHGTLTAGQAIVTTGGQLAAKYVIHCVGPIYRGGEHGEEDALASCYRAAVRLADERGLESMAFPSISTGAYRFPLHNAARIAVGTVLDELQGTDTLRHIRFVLFDVATLKAYSATAEKLAKIRPDCMLETSV